MSKAHKLPPNRLQKMWDELPPLPNTQSAARRIMGLCGQCPYCGEVYQIIQRSAGTRVFCPFCGVKMEEKEQ